MGRHQDELCHPVVRHVIAREIDPGSPKGCPGCRGAECGADGSRIEGRGALGVKRRHFILYTLCHEEAALYTLYFMP